MLRSVFALLTMALLLVRASDVLIEDDDGCDDDYESQVEPWDEEEYQRNDPRHGVDKLDDGQQLHWDEPVPYRLDLEGRKWGLNAWWYESEATMDIWVGASNKDLEKLKKGIAEGGDYNYRGSGGMTPVFMAVLNYSVTEAKYLIELGADVNIPNNAGFRLFDAAAFKGRTTLIPILYEYGLRPTHATDGFHPFHRACWGEKPKFGETVLEFLKKRPTIWKVKTRTDEPKTCRDITENEAVIEVLDLWMEGNHPWQIEQLKKGNTNVGAAKPVDVTRVENDDGEGEAEAVEEAKDEL